MEFDVAIIGSGAAGLYLALNLPQTMNVAILTKGALESGSTDFAQGGIAAVLDDADSIQSHIEDTLKAGAGLCDPKAVRFIVENGAKAIHALEEFGVVFTHGPDSGKGARYHLTQEGGHSHRRVVHSADTTGKAVESTLVSRVREQPNLRLYENFNAVDLVRETLPDGRQGRCIGFYALDQDAGHVVAVRARVTVIATGGASKVYLYTSNPDTSSGDGIAMAWRAGCRIVNMEFTQFHPTCLYHPRAKSFLISEAVRGEGGHLLLPDGSRFLDRFDSRAELAPRDIVARAIDHEMKLRGLECVYLDISYKPAEFIKSHFPNIYETCLKFGFDMTKGPLPVVPAAHYTCGGVMTDLSGRADIPGLFTVGEAAYTGLHGANRMASNSLLECLVMSAAAASHIARTIGRIAPAPAIQPWDESWVRDSDEEVVVSHNWDELRRFMWDYVGIVRSNKRLERAKHRVDLLLSEIDEYYSNFSITSDLLELRNLAAVADLIIRSAMERRESRGIHYTLDYPERDDATPPRPTVLRPPARKRVTLAETA
jgi:L-aspartate oxidase